MSDRYYIKDHMDVTHPAVAAFKPKVDKKGWALFNTGPFTSQFFDLHKERDYKGNERFYYDCTGLFTGHPAVQIKEFIDTIQELALDTHPVGKVLAEPPYDEKPKDAEGNVIDGAIAVKFKVAATWPRGDSRQPTFFDYAGRVIEPTMVFGGSEINLNFQVSAVLHEAGSKIGLRLEPLEVQILQMSEAPSRPPTGFDTRGEAPAAPASETSPGRRGNF